MTSFLVRSRDCKSDLTQTSTRSQTREILKTFSLLIVSLVISGEVAQREKQSSFAGKKLKLTQFSTCCFCFTLSTVKRQLQAFDLFPTGIFLSAPVHKVHPKRVWKENCQIEIEISSRVKVNINCYKIHCCLFLCLSSIFFIFCQLIPQ